MAGGRPSAFREEYAEQVLKLCRLGATEEEIADFFDVSVQTTYNWRDAHPEFLEAIKAGKMEADANVSERLYSRALGYSHPEEKIFQSEGEIIRADTIKHYPPDITACIFWLKNRRPKEWRERVDVTSAGEQIKSVFVMNLATREG